MKTTLLMFLFLGCSHSYTMKQAEEDFCQARAAYKQAAKLNPELAPTPGSRREVIENAEDAFCATLNP